MKWFEPFLYSIGLQYLVGQQMPRSMQDRKILVTRCQAVASGICFVVAILLKLQLMRPMYVYITLGMLQLVGRLEGSARSALTKACVPDNLLPKALTFNTLTTYVGELSAPGLFYLTVSLGGHGEIGLAVSLLVASIFYVLAALTPSLIDANGCPKGQQPNTNRNDDAHPTCVASMCTRYRAMLAGVAYIVRHPLLPGLYALDWGMTAVTFYREMFPMLVASMLTQDQPAGVTASGLVSLLTAMNYLGGTVGSVFTFWLLRFPQHGRQVTCHEICRRIEN